MGNEFQEKIAAAREAISVLRSDVGEKDKALEERNDVIQKQAERIEELETELNGIKKKAEVELLVDTLIEKRQLDPLRRDDIVQEILDKKADVKQIEELSSLLKAGEDNIGEIIQKSAGEENKNLGTRDKIFQGIIEAFQKY